MSPTPQLHTGATRLARKRHSAYPLRAALCWRSARRRARRESLRVAHESVESSRCQPLVQPAEATVSTVLFVDLASFTPLTATMGYQTAADVLRRFSGTVRGLAMERFVDTEPE